jgi:threonine/homoserine/homoserine lactone efflux protein
MMNTLATGFVVALFVSVPPGSNTALCVTSARNGARGAVPVILGAAATDVLYALLAAAGLIASTTFSAVVAHWLAAVFCLVAAALLWTRRTASVNPRAAVCLALLNPATAVLWLGLSARTVAHPIGIAATIFWMLGVAAGTTTWFSVLAFASSRVHRPLSSDYKLIVQRSASVAVAAAAVMLVV